MTRPARLLLLLPLLSAPCRADEPGPTFGSPFRFTETSGAALYASICAGCHMPNGSGAIGAGRYPALANNTNLAAAGYPIDRVLHGKAAMPPFARTLTDDQVAAVVAYIRTHFGNAYDDPPTPADVAASR